LIFWCYQQIKGVYQWLVIPLCNQAQQRSIAP
jgi:hypothetical protein